MKMIHEGTVNKPVLPPVTHDENSKKSGGKQSIDDVIRFDMPPRSGRGGRGGRGFRGGRGGGFRGSRGGGGGGGRYGNRYVSHQCLFGLMICTTKTLEIEHLLVFSKLVNRASNYIRCSV